MREAAIQKAIVALVKNELGGTVVKVDCLSYGGFPDLTCVLPGGRVVFLEVKQPGKYPTPLQKRRLDELRALGHVAEVCRSVTEARVLFQNLGACG